VFGDAHGTSRAKEDQGSRLIWPDLNYDPDLNYEVERVTRIELALSAWEADVLPLNYTRNALFRLAPGRPSIARGDGFARAHSLG